MKNTNWIVGWLARRARETCFVIVVFGSAAGRGADPPAEDVLEELESAYGGLNGFVARYGSEGENKILEVTLGLDVGSGVTVLHLVAERDGQKHVARQWSTPEGQLFMGSEGGLVVMDLTGQGLDLIPEWMALLNEDESEAALAPQMVPSVILEKTTVGAAIGWGSKRKPSWSEWVEGASVKNADEQTVTVATAEHGDLSISRETGLLVRQSMTGAEGEARVLELREVRIDPGPEAVAQVFSTWRTEGAQPVPSDSIAELFRFALFQGMVRAVDQGEMAATGLERRLAQGGELLESLAEACLKTGDGSVYAVIDWDKVLDKRSVHVRDDEEVQRGDEELIDAFLSSPEGRKKFRDARVVAAARGKDIDKSWLRISKEVFGSANGGNPELTARSEDGKAFKALLLEALGKAYLAVAMDRKMTELWGPAANESGD